MARMKRNSWIHNTKFSEYWPLILAFKMWHIWSCILVGHGPHIKVPLIFCFLFWFSTYAFITNCGLNWYVYILEIVLNILDKLIHDSRNICRCLTLNEMCIKLTSLIICLINDNLPNTWSAPPTEGKKH